MLGRPPLPTVPAPGEVLGRPPSSFFFSVPALGEVLGRPPSSFRSQHWGKCWDRPAPEGVPPLPSAWTTCRHPPYPLGGQLGLSPSLGTALRTPAGDDVRPLRDDLKQTTIRWESIANQRSHAQHHLILRLRTQCKQKEKCQKDSPQSGSHVRAEASPAGPIHPPLTRVPYTRLKTKKLVSEHSAKTRQSLLDDKASLCFSYSHLYIQQLLTIRSRGTADPGVESSSCTTTTSRREGRTTCKETTRLVRRRF